MARRQRPRRIVFIRPPAGTQILTVAGTEPWSSLPLSTRRELYRIGAEAGQNRRQVRAAYTANEPIGSSRYYQQRARAVSSGRLIPVRQGRTYGEYAPRSQSRINRLAQQFGLSHEEVEQELAQGTWRPFARKGPRRVPQVIRSRVANVGFDSSRDTPQLRAKRDQAIAEAYSFAARLRAAGNMKANAQTLAARLSMATEPQLDAWLAADDEGKKALAEPQPDVVIDLATLPATQVTNPLTGAVEYYHPITGMVTGAHYIHDNFAWYH